MSQKSPTQAFYQYLQAAYDHFNEALFQSALPQCLITMQREKKVMGYTSKDRWGNAHGKTVYELALNPAYFANHKLIEVFQTLAHEQCHIWQDVAGKTSPRRSYHNREWADKMKAIGLQPSETGRPGGKETGQRMSDYPIKGGLFEQTAQAFVSDHDSLPWIDRMPASNPSCQSREFKSVVHAGILTKPLSELATGLVIAEPEQIKAARRVKQKVAYQCPDCSMKVWGKPSLKILCGECGSALSSNTA